jgi:carbon storage regulator
MLTFTRRAGERIVIGGDIEVTILDVGGGRVRVGVTAPRSVPIHRGEVVERIEAENRRALQSAAVDAPQSAETLEIRGGLLGLRIYTRFWPCEVPNTPSLRLLVAEDDPGIRFVIADAASWFPDYPLEIACAVSGIPLDDAIVAIILVIPSDGSPPSANLLAPVVISTKERYGVQVVLDATGLSSRAPLDDVADPALLRAMT